MWKGKRLTKEEIDREAAETAKWHGKTANRYSPEIPTCREPLAPRRKRRAEPMCPVARRIAAGFAMIGKRYR